ncbi:MAG TPA: ATP-binding cassette domain-containing protein [Streptosporangiaceae bacterium]|jgi:daunorubicin resistance ABC transporter ATP-binding subunit|nr:ATP-binding cassette domain-containing protein [Streptosporangiaceae bacterium]
MSQPTVEACDLRKSYGEVRALDGLSLAVTAGSVLGLLGPNGSGKTTTVSILATSLRPDAGRAIVAGLDVVTQAAQVRRVIGLAGQFAAVDANLTGRENLRLIGRLSRVGRAQARIRADDLLDRFGLTAAADRLVRGYSGGMRRRLDVAAALLHRPPVLFLDEPTSGLDPESRFALWDAVRDLARSGTAVLLTTQYLEEADALADQVMIISAGRAADTGTPAELKARFGSVVFHLGFGAPQAAQAAQTALASAGYRPERDGGGLQVRSASGSGELAGLLRALDGRAPDPVSVQVREPTLDDVFLSLTHGGEAA